MSYHRTNHQNFCAHEIRLLQYIHLVLGLVLIAGGTLKLYAFAIAEEEIDLWALLLAFLSEAEVFAGLWLVSRCHPEQTRPWVIAIFTGYWTASIYWVLSGRCSCGCFGSLSVSPWYVLLFDTIALALLLRWRPSTEGQAEKYSNSLSTFGMVLTSLLVIVAGIQQQTFVTVAGSATWRGRPLADAPLVFRGNSLELQILTDHRGYFRLPSVRPGQYSVSTRTSSALSESKLATPEQTRNKILRRPQRNHSKKSVERIPKQPSAVAREYADFEIVLLEIGECSVDNLAINFN